MATDYTTIRAIDCPKCGSSFEVGSSLSLVENVFDSALVQCGVVVRCSNCYARFILCAHCPYISLLTKHSKRYIKDEHRSRCNGAPSRNEIDDFNNNDADHYHNDMEHDNDDQHDQQGGADDDAPAPMMMLRDFVNVFHNTQSARYFFDKHRSDSDMGGAMGMVYRCKNNIDDGTVFADKDDTKLYFDLFAVVFDLPESKQKLQMNFLMRLYNMNQSLLRPGESGVTIPLTHLQLKQQLLRNNASLAKQLPIERFENVDNIHAMVSIDDTITLQMAHGNHPVGWLQTEDGTLCSGGINGSPHAERLLAKQRDNIRNQGYNPDKVAIGWVSVWSDGFVTSWIKQKEKGAWVFTVTISMPGDCEHFEAYTHVVGLGPQEADHDTLINHALREIGKLTIVKRRYCGLQKKFIDTSFVLLVYSADRPERYKITFTTDGGTFHKCFGVAAILDPKNLPSCERCFKSRVAQMCHNVFLPNGNNSICDDESCCDWNFDTPDSEVWKNSARLDQFFPPQNRLKYPNTVDTTVQNEVPECRPIPTGYIRPQRLTFELLIKCVAVTFYHLTLGKWLKNNAEAYLSSIGIRVKGGVLDMVVNAAATANDEIKDIQDANEKQQKVKSMMSAKELLRLKAIPELWYLALELGIVNMDSFIEIPMHHLFTGITKDLVNILMAILKKGGNTQKFKRLANPFIQYLGSTLRLAFCVARRVPNTKWCSENYVAFARLTPFMFGIYFKEYGESTSFMSSGSGSILLQRLVNVYNVLISTLMRPNQADVSKDVIDNVVKIYLSCLNDLDKAIGKKVDENIGLWSKKNPISLLNLGQQIEDKGPARFYWDGKNEGKIPECKSDLSKMRLSLSFFQTKLARIRRRVSLRNIQRHFDNSTGIDGEPFYVADDDDDDTTSSDDDDEGDDMAVDHDHNINANAEIDGADGEDELEEEDGDDTHRRERGEWYRGCYRYKNLEHLQSAFTRGKFVSCYLRTTGGLWAYVNSGHTNKDEAQICELIMEDEDVQKCCGSSFFRFTVSDTVETITLEESKEQILRNCLLLPLHSTATFGGRFAAITDEWEVLLNGLSISYPTIDESLFNFQPAQLQPQQPTDEHARNTRRRTS